MSNVIKAADLAIEASSDMSLIGLISHADLVVKIVILMLIISSIWSWTIIFNKMITLRYLNNITDKFEKLFESSNLFEQLYERIRNRSDHPIANIFTAAMGEWTGLPRKTSRLEQTSGTKERIYQSMNLVKNKEIDKLDHGINFLAIVSSNAPFIGLFGTVWGIMHSFQSIAASKNTTLSVVAPGIAEALLATAIGLIAAIPAAMFYNILMDKINKFSNRLDDFSNEIGIILSRDLDDRM